MKLGHGMVFRHDYYFLILLSLGRSGRFEGCYFVQFVCSVFVLKIGPIIWGNLLFRDIMSVPLRQKPYLSFKTRSLLVIMKNILIEFTIWELFKL